MSDDHAPEPVRGLPEPLPPGETILWQGAPQWGAFARRAFHTGSVALYFGILLVWQIGSGLTQGLNFATALGYASGLAIMGLLALTLLNVLAWSYARSTVYTITERRLVIRSGVALPKTINVPFREVVAANARVHKDGTADIPLTLREGSRMPYLMLWPHARPLRFVKTQPMLRAVPRGDRVARLLGESLGNALRDSRERERAPQTSD